MAGVSGWVIPTNLKMALYYKDRNRDLSDDIKPFFESVHYMSTLSSVLHLCLLVSHLSHMAAYVLKSMLDYTGGALAANQFQNIGANTKKMLKKKVILLEINHYVLL